MNSFSPSIPQFAGGKLTQALQQILRDLWEILILKNFSKSFFKFAWHNQIFKFKSIVISWVQLFSIVSYFKYGKSWFSNLWLLPKDINILQCRLNSTYARYQCSFAWKHYEWLTPVESGSELIHIYVWCEWSEDKCLLNVGNDATIFIK